MHIVNVATLKEKLSYYLGLVKQGEEVVVTSHRHEVARMVPTTASTCATKPPSRPVTELRKLKGVRPQQPISAVDTLLNDRRRR